MDFFNYSIILPISKIIFYDLVIYFHLGISLVGNY